MLSRKIPAAGAGESEDGIMSVPGIDVSGYQKTPDWTKVKKSGMKFVILRIMDSKGLDASFEANYKGCGAAGLARGAYRYSYALTEEKARAEAQEVLKALAGRKLEMGVWLDLEWSKQRALGAEKVKSIADAWIKVIQKGGYSCGIYCNRDWYLNVCGGMPVKYWIARYASPDNGKLNPALKPNVGEAGWQYSDKGKVDGIQGNVDLDIWYEDLNMS